MENKNIFVTEEIREMIDNADLTKTPPATEPERQCYFIKKAKEYVSQLKKELGRPVFSCTKSFGCQMNV